MISQRWEVPRAAPESTRVQTTRTASGCYTQGVGGLCYGDGILCRRGNAVAFVRGAHCPHLSMM